MPRNAKTILPVFADRVKKARHDANGFTQEQLAEKLGVSVGTVQSWESRATPREPESLSQLINLATALHVSTDYLLGLSDEEDAPLRDVAKTIGISQVAVNKLISYRNKYGGDHKWNYTLNSLIMSRGWDMFCERLASLSKDMREWSENPKQPADNNKSHSLTLTGESLFRYQFDQLIQEVRTGLLEYLRFDEIIRAGNNRRRANAKMAKDKAAINAAIKELLSQPGKTEDDV